MLLGQKTEPRFSQPVRQIISMVVVLVLVVMIVTDRKSVV